MIEKRWYRIALLALVVLLYITANAMDYHYTIKGVAHGISSEANPVGQNFIKAFGLKKGLQLYKISLVALIITGTALIEIRYCQEKKIPAPTTVSCWILGLGAVLTLLAVGIWIQLFLSS